MQNSGTVKSTRTIRDPTQVLNQQAKLRGTTHLTVASPNVDSINVLQHSRESKSEKRNVVNYAAPKIINQRSQNITSEEDLSTTKKLQRLRAQASTELLATHSASFPQGLQTVNADKSNKKEVCELQKSLDQQISQLIKAKNNVSKEPCQIKLNALELLSDYDRKDVNRHQNSNESANEDNLKANLYENDDTSSSSENSQSFYEHSSDSEKGQFVMGQSDSNKVLPTFGGGILGFSSAAFQAEEASKQVPYINQEFHNKLKQRLEQRAFNLSQPNSSKQQYSGRNTLESARDNSHSQTSLEQVKRTEAENKELQKLLGAMPAIDLPNPYKQHSLKPDMFFGWKPENVHGAPIPLHFDFEQFELPTHVEDEQEYPAYYIGKRFKDSLDMHRQFANKQWQCGPDTCYPSYHYKFPPFQNVIDALDYGQRKKRGQDDGYAVGTRDFTGMNPLLMIDLGPKPLIETDKTRAKLTQEISRLAKDSKHIPKLTECRKQLVKIAGPNFKQPYIFDSSFESGNLDMVVQVGPREFDLYMRVDSNTRGHHQWFFFKIKNQCNTGPVKINVVNFTKKNSLYLQGMQVNIKSAKETDEKLKKIYNPNEPPFIMPTLDNEGWTKGGTNISYRLSKLSQTRQFIDGTNIYNYPEAAFRRKKYYQVSFEYDFKHEHDETFFSYCMPYPFSKLQNFLRQISRMKGSANNQLEIHTEEPFIKESKFCCSLSGLDVPMLTVTSRVNHLTSLQEVNDGFYHGAPMQIDPRDYKENEKDKIPVHKFKKYKIICARVHPGESNASYVMQGFIKFITSNQPEAVDLRRRHVFKIIPMTNPDGVIAGNYRTSLSGNDLNRTFIDPNPKLHPIVCEIKKLVRDILAQAKEPEPIQAFIDIHGHSRKKGVFMYGPHYPLHSEKYLKMRVIPKLLDERTQMFRFYSCKFKIEKSKLRAARVVLFKEFGLMNCFTLEASFHGYIEKDRSTTELGSLHLESMGEHLVMGFHEYSDLIDEDSRVKYNLRQQFKSKKKKMKAADIAKAVLQKQDSKEFSENKNSTGGPICSSDVENDSKYQTNIQNPQKQQLNSGRNLQTSAKGIRSASQNIAPSSRRSSANNLLSDTATTTGSDENASGVKSQIQRSKSLQREDAKNNAPKPEGEVLHSIISEEELSVCRSEGSPPRKAARGKTQKGQKPKVTKPQLLKSKTALPKQLEEIQKSEGELEIGQEKAQKRTLNMLYKDLKRPPKKEELVDSDEQNQSVEGEEDEDDIAADSDDLDAKDMKNIHSDILNAIKQFDQMYHNKKKPVQDSKATVKPPKEKKTKKKKPERKHPVVDVRQPCLKFIDAKREADRAAELKKYQLLTGNMTTPTLTPAATSSIPNMSQNKKSLSSGRPPNGSNSVSTGLNKKQTSTDGSKNQSVTQINNNLGSLKEYQHSQYRARLNKLQTEKQTSTQLELRKPHSSMVHQSKKTPKDIVKGVEEGGTYMTANFKGAHSRTSSQNHPSQNKDHATKTLLAAAAVEDQRNNFEVGPLPKSAKNTGNLTSSKLALDSDYKIQNSTAQKVCEVPQFSNKSLRKAQDSKARNQMPSMDLSANQNAVKQSYADLNEPKILSRPTDEDDLCREAESANKQSANKNKSLHQEKARRAHEIIRTLRSNSSQKKNQNMRHSEGETIDYEANKANFELQNDMQKSQGMLLDMNSYHLKKVSSKSNTAARVMTANNVTNRESQEYRAAISKENNALMQQQDQRNFQNQHTGYQSGNVFNTKPQRLTNGANVQMNSTGNYFAQPNEPNILSEVNCNLTNNHTYSVANYLEQQNTSKAKFKITNPTMTNQTDAQSMKVKRPVKTFGLKKGSYQRASSNGSTQGLGNHIARSGSTMAGVQYILSQGKHNSSKPSHVQSLVNHTGLSIGPNQIFGSSSVNTSTERPQCQQRLSGSIQKYMLQKAKQHPHTKSRRRNLKTGSDKGAPHSMTQHTTQDEPIYDQNIV